MGTFENDTVVIERIDKTVGYPYIAAAVDIKGISVRVDGDIVYGEIVNTGE